MNVLTGGYDNSRANVNLAETQLTVGNVTTGSFGKLGAFPVDGQVYTQPLYIGSVAIPGNGTHNLLIVCTQHNSVYAWDADSAASPNLIWRVNLGPSVPSTALGDYGDIAPEIGILSTPVIDPQRGVIYAVAELMQNNAPSFQIHALDIRTGKDQLNGPVTVAGQVPGTGAASADGIIAFDPYWHIQRPALLLANGGVTVAFGSHGDDGPWHGWLFTYSASDLSQPPAVLNVTPKGTGGSIWQTGRGMAADASGNLYAVSGNGDYDGVANFSQTFLKLSPTLSLSDWFTPANNQYLSENDFDLSAGPVLVPGTGLVLGGDKAGQLYLLNSGAMGHGTSGTAQIFVAVPTGGIFNMALWPRADGANVYIPQLNGPFECFRISGGTFNQTPVSASATGGTDPYEGMTVSANGTQDGTGILWATTGDNTQVTLPGTLHAYDAANLANEIWNSDMTGGPDALGTFAKFANPTVANGNVYVSTWSNSVVVYGLPAATGGGQPPPVIAAVANSASYAVDAVSPGALVAIFGSNIGPVSPAGLTLDASGNVLTTSGGVQVLFDGVPAPMIYAAANQVNAVVPFGIAGPTTQVQVVYGGQSSPFFPMSVAPATPAAFTSDGSGSGEAAVLNQDYSINSPENPAAPGSVVTIYAEGAGQMNPPGQDGSVPTPNNLPQPVLPVSVLVNDQPASTLYAGAAPGFVEGVLQINVQIPDSLPAGAVSLVIQVGTSRSQQGLTMAVGSGQ